MLYFELCKNTNFRPKNWSFISLHTATIFFCSSKYNGNSTKTLHEYSGHVHIFMVQILWFFKTQKYNFQIYLKPGELVIGCTKFALYITPLMWKNITPQFMTLQVMVRTSFHAANEQTLHMEIHHSLFNLTWESSPSNFRSHHGFPLACCGAQYGKLWCPYLNSAANTSTVTGPFPRLQGLLAWNWPGFAKRPHLQILARQSLSLDGAPLPSFLCFLVLDRFVKGGKVLFTKAWLNCCKLIRIVPTVKFGNALPLQELARNQTNTAGVFSETPCHYSNSQETKEKQR
jgi:hypothetical protein